MGLYDRLTVKYALPVKEHNLLDFQTKSLCHYMEDYEIREDGTLWLAEVERDWVDDPTSPLGGHLVAVSTTWKQLSDFSGEIVFYGVDDKEVLVEYLALLSDGKVLKLKEHKREIPQ
jgi:hypothetical protein